MAIWSPKANKDMEELVGQEGAAKVNSIRAEISRWADEEGSGHHTKTFQAPLRYPVVVSTMNREILSVEHD